MTGHCSNGQVNFSKCYFMNILHFTFSVVIGIFLEKIMLWQQESFFPKVHLQLNGKHFGTNCN